MKKKKTLPTGEFAKLCKTTKATLFHYDRENVLKPRHVSENGYRHYGVEQFFDFDMITMLRETGSSLKEIKACLHDAENGNFLSLLEAKRLVVKKERKKLAQREMMIRDMIMCTREALNFAYDAFMVQEHKEERLEIVPTSATSAESTPELIERLVEYIDFYERQERMPRYPFGVVIDQDAALNGQYLERYFFSRATQFTPHNQLHIKPEGSYAVFAHQGTVQTHLQAFDQLLAQIKSVGLAVAGNVYGYDMMSYVFQGAGASYACKYCMPVK